MKMSPIDPDAETTILIEHIVENYHAAHRREMPELVALARMVEDLHGTDPAAPHGLADALAMMTEALEAHMQHEELQIFPALAHGRTEAINEPIAGIRDDHHEHERTLARIAAMTHGFRLPPDACGPWKRLYAGTRKLVEDLDEHFYLENEVLFPRFESGA